MADRDYIIRILLQAQDDTARAVAEATANLKAFEQASKESARQQNELARSYEANSQAIEKGNANLRSATELWNKRISQDKEATAALANLERAVRAEQKALDDGNASLAQRQNATNQVIDAEGKLASAINETYKVQNAASKARAEGHAANIAALTRETEATRSLASTQEQAAKAEMANIREADRARADAANNRRRLLNELDKTEADIDRRRKQRMQEDLAEVRRIESERKAIDQERIARRRELDKILDQSDKEAASREQQAFRDKIARYDAEVREIKKLEAERKRAADQAARDEAQRRRELDRILNQSDREAEQRARAAHQAKIARYDDEVREIRKLEAERKRAADEAARQEIQRRRELDRILDRSDREAEQRQQQQFRDKIKRYDDEVREIRKLEAEREQAAQRERDRPLEQARATQEYVKALEDVARKRRQLAEGVEGFERIKVEAETNEAEIKLTRIAVRAAEIGALSPTIDVEADVAAAIAQLELAKAATKDLGGEAGRTGGFFSRMSQTMGDSFETASSKTATFDNMLRGLMSLGVAAFLQPIVVLAGAAAGALGALASSAVTAGAALGGALAAGAMQAIPVLGVLASAMSRIKAVTDAVKQANLLEQQASAKSKDQQDKQANAALAVAAAQDAVADAHRRVQQAQEGLTEAREEAREKLEDLILAERGATLSAAEAQEALRKAIRSGSTGDIDRARLRVDETRLARTRTRQDLSERQEEGVAGSPEVTRATETMRDAERAVRNADRQLQRAKRSANEAADSSMAAAEKLDFLLSKLSPAERRLYTAMKNLQDQFRGVAQTFTEPLINATTHAVNRISTLLNNRALIADVTKLSGGMAAQFRRAFDVFTSNEMVGRFRGFMGQARQNLAPLTTIIINLGKSFMNIAESAGPALNRIIRWVRDISKAFLDATEKGKETGSLGRFFQTGVTHLQAWFRLLKSIGEIFLAIMGPGGGAHTGLGILEDLTKAFHRMAKSIADPDSSIHKFFNEFFRLSRQIMRELGPVLGAVGKEFQKTFNKDGAASVHSFAQILIHTLIPAIGNFIRWIGKATTEVGNFIEKHPGMGRIVAGFIAFAAVGSIVTRVTALLTPLGAAFKFIAGEAAPLISRGSRLAGIFAKIAPEGSKLAGAFRIMGTAARGLLGPWGLVIGIVVLMLKRFGFLDDVWRGIQRAWTQFTSRLKEPIANLKESFCGLSELLGGNGNFMKAMKIITHFIGRTLISTVGVLGSVIGDVLGTAINVIAGVIDMLTGILTLDPDRFWRGMKKIGTAIFEGLTGAVKDIGRWFVELFVNVLRMIGEFLGIASPSKKFIQMGKDLANGLIEGFKSLPGLLSRAVHAMGDALFDIGKRIGRAIVDGIKKLPGGGAILDALGKGGKLLGKLNPFAKGGPVPGSGEGDTVAAMLTPGEHVLTKAEVAAAGGHGVIFALRRMLGGGGQGGPGYDIGGAVGAQDGGQITLRVNATADIGGIASTWRKTWAEVVASTRRNAQTVEARMRTMRVNIENTTNRMSREYHERWRRMTSFTQDSSDKILRTVSASMGSLKSVVYDGMSYVGNATNDALKAFDAKSIKLNIRKPGGDGKAGGGWIGQPGERGRDAIPTWLGRGEAVLNWGHQKVVNSALWNQYGTTLDGLFKSSHGYHAGGPGTAPGFAQGGNTGPGHSGAGFIPVWNLAKTKFKMTNFTGFDGHSVMTASGNRSDHNVHMALDMSNGVLTPQEDAMSNFYKSKLPQVVKQLIWRNVIQAGSSVGYPVPGHEDHVHLALKQQYAFDQKLMARLISRASRGLSVSDLLKGATGDEEGVAVEHIDPPKFTGDKFWAKVLKGLFKKIVGGANDYIDKKAGTAAPGSDVGPMHGQSYDGPLNHRFPRHFADQPGHVQLTPTQVMELAQKAGLPGRPFEQIAHGESNYYPGVVQRDPGDGNVGYGLWQMTPHAWGPGSLAFAMMNKLGGVSEMLNPWKNALMAKFLYSAAGNRTSPWYGTRFLTSAQGGFAGGIPQFAKGGEVPGGPGNPIPIIAHAGEWIVNQMQQNRLAAALGTSVGKLRDMLGFSGGPGSFQGGGEVGDKKKPERRTAVEIYEEIEKHLKNLSEAHGKNKQKEIDKENERHRKYMKNLTDEQREQARRFSGAGREGRRAAFARAGEYREPLVDPTGMAGISREIGLVQTVTVALSRKSKWRKNLEDFLKASELLSKEDGLLDRFAAAVETMGGRLTRQLELKQVGLHRVGGKLRQILTKTGRFNPETDLVAIAEGTVDNLTAVGDGLREYRKKVENALARVRRQINRIRAGGISKEEEDDYGKLIAAQKNFTDRLDKIDEDILQNEKDKWEARVNAFNARTDDALKRPQRRQAQAELDMRVATAKGNQGGIETAAQGQLDALNEQQRVIQERLARARELAKKDPRWQATADELAEKLNDLTGSIAEQASEIFNSAVEQLDRRMTRRMASLDISGRGLDVAERMGNRLGAAQGRIGLSDQRIGVLNENYAGLAALRNRAAAEGRWTAFEDLSDKMEDLGAQINEENQTRRELVFTYRQTATDLISGRQERGTGLIGTAREITQKIGELAGIVDTNKLGAFLQQTMDTLRTSAGEIVANVMGSTGEFGSAGGGILGALGAAFQAGPQDFADKLAALGPAIAALESTMGDTEKGAFQALIQSMIDNTTATLDTTTELKNLNGNLAPQGFASSAWQWFREAIFTGMGDVLPQYQVPHADTGGYVRRGGLMNLHAGELITNPSRGQIGREGDLNITVNQDDSPLDISYLASRMQFERKTARAASR